MTLSATISKKIYTYKAFFVYGFAKNVRANIRPDELKGLKLLAAQMLRLSDKELEIAIKGRVLVEVNDDE
ncbi:MAG: hypothetical protein ACJAYF_002722 [Arenicella sp.]|jgi:hypothetical protein